RTPEARFARALDRLQPMLLNMQTGGGTWVAHDVPLDQVLSKVELIEDGPQSLGGYARAMIAEAVELGFLRAVAGPHAGKTPTVSRSFSRLFPRPRQARLPGTSQPPAPRPAQAARPIARPHP